MRVVVDDHGDDDGDGDGDGDSQAVSKAWIAAAVVGLVILTCLAAGGVYSVGEYSKRRDETSRAASRAGSHAGGVTKQEVEVEVNFSASCTSGQRL